MYFKNFLQNIAKSLSHSGGMISGPLFELHRIVKEIEPWGLLVAVFGLSLALYAFWLDHEDRIEGRSVRAWQLLATENSGNNGKKEAIEYLNKKDGIFCGENNCLWVLKHRTPLIGIDLSSTEDGLHETVLMRAWLPSVIFIRAKLSGVDLYGANLSNGDLREVDLTRAELSNANLRSANLSYADFAKSSLNGASLDGAVLTGASFEVADLEGASFEGVVAESPTGSYTLDIEDIRRQYSKNRVPYWARVEQEELAVGQDPRKTRRVRGAMRRSSTDSGGRDQNGSDCSSYYNFGGIWPDFAHSNLGGASFRGANFTLVNFYKANLELADFTGAVFGCGHLKDAILRGADFSGADLSALRPDHGAITQEQLNEACGDKNTKLPKGMKIPFCSNTQ